MMSLDKNQGTNIIMDMLEQVGAVELLQEIIQGMSSDELTKTIDELDRYVFDRHYAETLVEDECAFDWESWKLKIQSYI